jgi:hypothetical protein
VLTHGDARTGWFHSHAIRAADLPRPKRESRRPLALFAGAGAAQALLGVINEIRLIRYPVLLGRGTPLFREGRATKPAAGRHRPVAVGRDAEPLSYAVRIAVAVESGTAVPDMSIEVDDVEDF